MWSTGELCEYFVDQRKLADIPPRTVKKFHGCLLSALILPWTTALFTSLVSFNEGIVGIIFWSVSLGVLLGSLYNFIKLLVIDHKYGIVRNRLLLVLLVLLAFICPFAAAIKSIFTTTIDESTGEWTHHYFDVLFLLFVYIPVQAVFSSVMHYAYIRPLASASYPNYAEVVAREGRIFLNCWDWNDPRGLLPSIDDYDVKGRPTRSRLRPLYAFVVDENVLDSIESEKDRKRFAIYAGLSLMFALHAGFVPVILGFGFDRPIMIVFSVLCFVNFVPFLYFSIRLICLSLRYPVFKNSVALWVSLVLGTALAVGFTVAGYFNTINEFGEDGSLMVHLINGGTLLGYLVACLSYFIFVFYAYWNPLLRHFGKRP